MASIPSMIFNPTILSIGEIDVGSSSVQESYAMKHSVIATSCDMADMKNISISFEESTNATEARSETWLWLSTASDSAYVGSIGAAECAAPSVAQDNSIYVKYRVHVPSGAATSGTVLYKHHHRYQRDLAYIC